MKKVNEIPVTFRYLYSDKIFYSKYFTRPRPKSGNDERILQIALDGTQGIAHAKAKVSINIKMCG